MLNCVLTVLGPGCWTEILSAVVKLISILVIDLVIKIETGPLCEDSLESCLLTSVSCVDVSVTTKTEIKTKDEELVLFVHDHCGS